PRLSYEPGVSFGGSGLPVSRPCWRNGALADTADLKHYAGMSETPEPSIPPPPAAPAPVIASAAPQSERLYQVAAWVAIVAGVTLIAVVILKFVWVLGY